MWSSTPFVEDSMSIDRDYFSLPFFIQRQSSPMTCRYQYGHLHPLSKTQCLSTRLLWSSLRHPETIKFDDTQKPIWSSCQRLNVNRLGLVQFPIRQPETIKSDDTQRPIWSSARFSKGSMFVDKDYFSLLFTIQRQSSPMARGDKLGSSSTFAIQRQSSPIAHRDEYGHLPSLVEDSMCFGRDYYSLPFAIQRQSSLVACRDRNGHSLLLFRDYQIPLIIQDKQVRWYAGTMRVIRFQLFFEIIAVPFCYSKTIKFDGMQRKTQWPASLVERLNVW